MSIYGGPDPKTVDISFSDHTDELITCLVTGKQAKRLTEKYFRSIGYTRERYLTEFAGAPLISNAMRAAYKNMWTDEDKARKRDELDRTRSSDGFEEKRKRGWDNFKNSDEYDRERQRLSTKAKNQHTTTDLCDKVREYFRTTFIGSADQMKRRERWVENNPNYNPELKEKQVRHMIMALNNKTDTFKRKKFRDTGLTYQSSYELDFLERCFDYYGLTEIQVQNGIVFQFDKLFYIADFVLFGVYAVEIKSWYIEKLQEKNKPGTTATKQHLVENSGFKWLYIKDKDYHELDEIVAVCV